MEPVRQFGRWRWALRLLLGVGVVLLLAESVRVLALTNRHSVIPGRVYRSSQPAGKDIREFAQKNGIRTVINLRGISPEFPWYQEESCATCELGIAQEDITFSAQSLPSPRELRRLVEVLDHTEYPILIHCKRGADRTGLVSALTLLLFTDAQPTETRRQLWPRFGHFRFGRTAAIDLFFDQYDAWLANRQATHSREIFRDWLLNHYCPGPARSKLEYTDAKSLYPKATPIVLTLKATNQSIEPWEFQPGLYAGIHVSYQLHTASGERLYDSRAGYFRRTVPPGQSVEIPLSIPGLPPGEYILNAELHDARSASVPFRINSFVKFGDDSAPLRFRVE